MSAVITATLTVIYLLLQQQEQRLSPSQCRSVRESMKLGRDHCCCHRHKVKLCKTSGKRLKHVLMHPDNGEFNHPVGKYIISRDILKTH